MAQDTTDDVFAPGGRRCGAMPRGNWVEGFQRRTLTPATTAPAWAQDNWAFDDYWFTPLTTSQAARVNEAVIVLASAFTATWLVQPVFGGRQGLAPGTTTNDDLQKIIASLATTPPANAFRRWFAAFGPQGGRTFRFLDAETIDMWQYRALVSTFTPLVARRPVAHPLETLLNGVAPVGLARALFAPTLELKDSFVFPLFWPEAMPRVLWFNLVSLSQGSTADEPFTKLSASLADAYDSIAEGLDLDAVIDGLFVNEDGDNPVESISWFPLVSLFLKSELPKADVLAWLAAILRAIGGGTDYIVGATRPVREPEEEEEEEDEPEAEEEEEEEDEPEAEEEEEEPPSLEDILNSLPKTVPANRSIAWLIQALNESLRLYTDRGVTENALFGLPYSRVSELVRAVDPRIDSDFHYVDPPPRPPVDVTFVPPTQPMPDEFFRWPVTPDASPVFLLGDGEFSARIDQVESGDGYLYEAWLLRAKPTIQLANTLELATTLFALGMHAESLWYPLTTALNDTGKVGEAIRGASNLLGDSTDFRLDFVGFGAVLRDVSLARLVAFTWKQSVVDSYVFAWAAENNPVECLYMIFCWMEDPNDREVLDLVLGPVGGPDAKGRCFRTGGGIWDELFPAVVQPTSLLDRWKNLPMRPNARSRSPQGLWWRFLELVKRKCRDDDSWYLKLERLEPKAPPEGYELPSEPFEFDWQGS